MWVKMLKMYLISFKPHCTRLSAGLFCTTSREQWSLRYITKGPWSSKRVLLVKIALIWPSGSVPGTRSDVVVLGQKCPKRCPEQCGLRCIPLAIRTVRLKMHKKAPWRSKRVLRVKTALICPSGGVPGTRLDVEVLGQKCPNRCPEQCGLRCIPCPNPPTV